MSGKEANNHKSQTEAATEALRTLYRQPQAENYNVNQALNALLSLTERSRSLLTDEAYKKLIKLRKFPRIHLYQRVPNNLVPVKIKQERRGFQISLRKGPNSGPPRVTTTPKKDKKEDPIKAPHYENSNLNRIFRSS